jgi:hypothetical protein
LKLPVRLKRRVASTSGAVPFIGRVAVNAAEAGAAEAGAAGVTGRETDRESPAVAAAGVARKETDGESAAVAAAGDNGNPAVAPTPPVRRTSAVKRGLCVATNADDGAAAAVASVCARVALFSGVWESTGFRNGQSDIGRCAYVCVRASA